MQRRQLYKVIGASVAGTVGLGSTPATAHGHTGEVSTRGHFEINWGDVELTDGHDETDFDTDGIPGDDEGDPPDELAVMVHGFRNDESDARQTFGDTADGLRATDYDSPVVGFSWDSDQSALQWWSTTEIARRNGPKLAAFLDDFAGRNGGTTIRLVAHSLGAQVALSALATLRERDGTRPASLTLLGAAVEDQKVAVDGEFGPAVAEQGGRADNFWKSDDDVLAGFGGVEFDGALGRYGAQGETPDNYEDHQVDYVNDHGSYYLADGGCLHEVVAEW